MGNMKDEWKESTAILQMEENTMSPDGFHILMQSSTKPKIYLMV